MKTCNFKCYLNTLTLLLAFILSSCHHTPTNPRLGEEWQPLPPGKRKSLLKKQSQTKHEYDGLKLIYKATGTFLNEALLRDNLKMRAQYELWSLNEAEDKLAELNLKKVDTAYFIISIYSNNKRLNKLHVKASEWSVALLLNNGQDILEGEADLLDPNSDHVSVYYPHVESWNKTYLVSFDIGTQKLETIEDKEFRLMTPEGMTRFPF